jgi:hypothetical protein
VNVCILEPQTVYVRALKLSNVVWGGGGEVILASVLLSDYVNRGTT